MVQSLLQISPRIPKVSFFLREHFLKYQMPIFFVSYSSFIKYQSDMSDEAIWDSNPHSVKADSNFSVKTKSC